MDKTTYEKYKSLKIDKGLLCLEEREEIYPYFCYPDNAKAIGFEGNIMYCFIDGYEDMVFACNPESCASKYVYPLAYNFDDFISLILYCANADVLEQIIWMNEKQFNEHMLNEISIMTKDHKNVLLKLEKELNLKVITNPYAYVRNIQKDFNGSKIQFKDEYYEIVGIDIE